MVELVRPRTDRRSSLPLRRSGGPGRRPIWWVEALAALVVALVYFAAPSAPPADTAIHEAEALALSVLELERRVGLDVEAGVQSAVGGLGLQWVANWLYGTLHFAVTAAAFVALLRWRPDRYGQWRTAFVASSVAAFAWQRWMPLAPPRLVRDGAGSTLLDDWLKEHAAPWTFESGLVSEAANHYAAMPSMHVGWAVLSSSAFWGLTCDTRWRSVIAAYPVLITVVVMATGNHFLLDAVAGAVVVLVSLGLVRLVCAASQRKLSPPAQRWLPLWPAPGERSPRGGSLSACRRR